MTSALTAEVPAPPSTLRPGAIVLARHGEPALSRAARLNAQEYRQFWASYEVLGLLPGQTPPQALLAVVETCGALVASNCLRSVARRTAERRVGKEGGRKV